MSVNNFCIAELTVRIIFEDSEHDGMHLIPSFEPFRVDHIAEEPMLELVVKEHLLPLSDEQLKRVRAFDTGNGDIIVDHIIEGGYQYNILDLNKFECGILQTDPTFTKCVCALEGNWANRSFALNSVLMLTFAFASATKNALLIHASLVRNNGYGYAFIAKSGIGKSTQVSMWLRHIPNCDLMNDDNPIVRIIDDEVWIFGSPWSGKTPCYRNVRAKLGAITRIERASENSVEALSPIQAFASLLPSCSSMKWDMNIYNAVCDTITKVVEKRKLYTLHCLPNKEAAEICYNNIAIK